MLHDEMLTAIYTKFGTILDIPEIVYPNIEVDPSVDGYVRVNVLPANPDTVGVKSITWYRGIIQANVYVKLGVGEIVAARYAQKIIGAFPRGTVLTNGTTSIKIDENAQAYNGIVDGGYYMMPVRIVYNKLC